MSCPYECFVIGGPWIYTNPNCPEHGVDKETSYSYSTRELLEELIECWGELVERRETGLTLAEDFGSIESIRYYETAIREAKERLERLKKELS